MLKTLISRWVRPLLLAAALTAPVAANAANEDEFLSARDAFRAGDARKLDYHARRLNNYVLEPYVAYWQLRLRIEETSAAEVRRFLTLHADTPLSARILADWLRVLGRTGQ